MDDEVLEFLRCEDINTKSLNDIINDLNAHFNCDFSQRKQEIEDILVEIHGDDTDPSEDDDVKLAKELQSQEIRRSSRKPTVKPKTVRRARVKSGKPIRNPFSRPYNLSDELQRVIGKQVCSRPEVVKLLWSYIKTNDLQDTADRRFIICDDLLMAIFHKKRISCFGMNRFLSKHLTETFEEEAPAKDDTMMEPSLHVINVPDEWINLGFHVKKSTYHELQIHILSLLGPHRSFEDPDMIERPKDENLVRHLMRDRTTCSVFDILKEVRCVLQSQLNNSDV